MLFQLSVWAQEIISGPILGGVSPESARLYYRTDMAADLTIELSKQVDFSNLMSFNSSTSNANYFAVITELTGLEYDTRYYYRVRIDGELYDSTGYFSTFPEEDLIGYYKVVVGSCNYDNFRQGGGATSPDNYMNDVLFGSIKAFDPDLVIHLGDWNYPPSKYGAHFNLDPEKRADAFSFRYADYNFSRYINPHFPVDYMYDDSYSYNGSAGWTWPSIATEELPNGQTRYRLMDIPMDPGIRSGNIEGYFDHFPGYAQVDTSGVHHSFKLGNIEFFIVDTRNSKDPVHAGFRYNELLNIYDWQAPPGHSTLGGIQKEWLLEGLKNSDADWKVIGSSVVFNKNLSELMDVVLLGQLIDRSIIEYATAIAYMWPGYPRDMYDLLDAVREDSIDNVIMLSGDTHSTMMDDGKNSGIPEISASGWAAGNEGTLNYTIDSIIALVGLPTTTKEFLWNGGGVGVANNYIGDSYATLEFFYQDSMRSCVVDEFDQVLACQTLIWQGIKDSTTIPTATSYSYVPDLLFKLIYPNPARNRVLIEFSPEFQAQPNFQIRMLSSNGNLVKEFRNLDSLSIIKIPIAHLPRAVYLLQLVNGNEVETRRFVKH